MAREGDTWRQLLDTAKEGHLWVELENQIFEDTVDAQGRKTREPREAGYISVWGIGDRTFDLGIPVQGHLGITIVTTPFSMVLDMWMGVEQRLHIALKKDLLLKEGTTGFV